MFTVMSMLPKQNEERSKIYGNERLEFLGDAVIEIIARYFQYWSALLVIYYSSEMNGILFSIHLFFIFPDMSEGSLDHFRQALVQNQHLSDLALVSFEQFF